MFDYVANEFNPEPRLVVEPPAGRRDGRTRYLRFSEAIVVDLPSTQEELRARQPGRYWAELRRRERRFAEQFGPLVHRQAVNAEDVRASMPAVQQLYRERWQGEYTSLRWKHDDGFAPYVDAMAALAGQGRGRLQLLEGDGRLLAFGYCLLEHPWAYLYQHAATPDERYRRYGVGKLLVARLLQDLVEEGFTHLDFMLGDAAYKREWESWRREIHLRVHEPDTLAGRVRLPVRSWLHRTRLRVQFESPRLRAVLKRSLAVLDDAPRTRP
ncbi:GNAT family N-acetyltransferase [Egicoccus sp. AB-alg2]|uniref:GNAT family N-acetyltransferase n=1 Tax=Egicoccus sp. AB-alg2 TaxID=3242693 RepID=UPI00359D65FD